MLPTIALAFELLDFARSEAHSVRVRPPALPTIPPVELVPLTVPLNVQRWIDTASNSPTIPPAYLPLTVIFSALRSLICALSSA